MINSLKKTASKGFTIIEVMIVLAIAGLILVVVLVAVPQLQRNQRDSARQAVLQRLSTELGAYAGNNDGVYPFQSSGSNTLADFTSRYITGTGAAPLVDLKNPQTNVQYTLDLASAVSDAPSSSQILVYPGGTCSGESVTGTISATSRQYAVRLNLERGNIYHCVDNN